MTGKQKGVSIVQVTYAEIPYGVEIETIGRTRREVAEAIREIVGGDLEHDGDCYDSWFVHEGDERSWRVMSDSSLSADRCYQAEIATPILRYNDFDTLQRVLRAVYSCGAYTDDSCGVHVHVNARLFDGDALANLAIVVAAHEQRIMRALGVSDAKKARYAKPIDAGFVRRVKQRNPKTRNAMYRAWYNAADITGEHTDHYHPTRYYGLNFHSVFYRDSIEFRYFAGTLDSFRVRSYVDFALLLATRALVMHGRSEAIGALAGDTKAQFARFLQWIGMDDAAFAASRDYLLSLLPDHDEAGRDVAMSAGGAPASRAGDLSSVQGGVPPAVSLSNDGAPIVQCVDGTWAELLDAASAIYRGEVAAAATSRDTLIDPFAGM
jgi:Putative amidoligase enzyme